MKYEEESDERKVTGRLYLQVPSKQKKDMRREGKGEISSMGIPGQHTTVVP